MQDVTTRRLANRAAVEEALVQYWCRQPEEVLRESLRQNQVATKQGWDLADYQAAAEEYIRERPDSGIESLVWELPAAAAGEVPELEWTTLAPLIIIRQAPTGTAAVTLWLSGEEGKSSRQFGLPDRMESIPRGPDALEALRRQVAEWQTEFPGARVESEIPLDGELAPVAPAYTVRTGSRDLAMRQVGNTPLAEAPVKWVFSPGVDLDELELRGPDGSTIKTWRLSDFEDYAEAVAAITDAIQSAAAGGPAEDAAPAAPPPATESENVRWVLHVPTSDPNWPGCLRRLTDPEVLHCLRHATGTTRQQRLRAEARRRKLAVDAPVETPPAAAGGQVLARGSVSVDGRITWHTGESPAPPAAAPAENPPAPPAADQELPLARIRIRHNFRKVFNETKMAELTADVRQHGVLMPVLVRPADDGDGWELVAGERRYRASVNAGLTTIPARIKPMDRQRADELQLLENIQREDLSPLEEAEAYRYLMQEYGYTQEALAAKFNRSQSHISERLGLLEIRIPAVQEAVANGELSARAALALRPLMPPPDVKRVGRAVIEIGKLMVKEQWPAAHVAERLKGSIWHYTRSLQPLRDQPSLHYMPREALFPQAECASCPYRVRLKDRDHDTCLDPPCWDKKQGDAYSQWTEKSRRPEADSQRAREEQRRERETRQIEQTTRAIERIMGAGENAEDMPPAEDFAALVVRLHEVSRALEGWLDPKERPKQRAEAEQLAHKLGFEYVDSIRDWLGAAALGTTAGRLDPHKLPAHQLGAHLTEILAARRAGKTLDAFVRARRERVAQATLEGTDAKAAAAEAPPLADLTLVQKIAAEEMREAAKPHWQLLVEGRGRWTYDRQVYVPLPQLLQFWRDQSALGASRMPAQMDMPTVRIPGQGVWFNGPVRGEGPVRIEGERLIIETGNGAVEDQAPADPVYCHIQITGGGPQYVIFQLLYIRCEGRDLVVVSDSGAQVRRDLVVKWFRLLNALPAVPELREGAAD